MGWLYCMGLAPPLQWALLWASWRQYDWARSNVHNMIKYRTKCRIYEKEDANLGEVLSIFKRNHFDHSCRR